MRWRWCWLLALLAIFSIAAGPPTLRSGHAQPLRLTPGQLDSLDQMQRGPRIDAVAAALADRASGEVLWAQNAETALPPASTTKLMTALLALETLSPDQVVTVPVGALVGNASMGLDAGERVRVETLLYGALLPSGNDAAMTLALAAAGDETAFVREMNARAAAWGLNQTHFLNPHGLDAPGHLASALDLAALGRRALDNPLLAGVVGTQQITVEGYFLTNTNELLGAYPGAYGVKTGTTDEAGQVLIAAAARPGGDAVSVVMRSPDRYAESARLLDFYFEHWQRVETGLRADALNRLHAQDGSVYALRTPSRPLLLPRWQAVQLRTFRLIGADASGRPVGVQQIWLGEQKLVETAIEFILQQRPSPEF